MKITDILTEDLVMTRLPGSSKEEIIDGMIDLVAQSGGQEPRPGSDL
jgi:mannitol/fructose-specific phosphotransferase system IIA component (Ntr-type)